MKQFGRVLVPVSHFGPRAAPKLYGSPELGVLFPSCIGDLAGAPKKKKDDFNVVYICQSFVTLKPSDLIYMQ